MRGLIAYYPFCELAGLVAHDMTPNANHGTLSGDVTWAKPGVNIGPSQDRILSAASTIFPIEAGSIEILCRPSWSYDDGASHYFWDCYPPAAARFYLNKQYTNVTILGIQNSDRGSFVYPWVANFLYHIVVNWPENKLYINGSLAYDYNDENLGQVADQLIIGDAYSFYNFSFSGKMYYFRVRNLNLTEAEILYFYNQGKKIYGQS